MASANAKAESPPGGLAFLNSEENVVITILKILALFVLDALALVIIYGLLYTGSGDTIALAVVIALITILGNAVIFIPSLYPIKWMAPGLMLVTLLVIFPIYFTVRTAFTNYGDGHLFPKDRSIELISSRGYVPEGATTFDYVPFRADDDTYALWLNTGSGDIRFALPGEDFQQVSLENSFGITLGGDLPEINGFEIVEDVSILGEIESLSFGSPVDDVRIATLDLETRYFYDIEQDLVYDQERGDLYNVTVFVNEAGEFAFWLTESGVDSPDEAQFVIPGEDIDDIELDNTNALARQNIDLPRGTSIPEAIGDFGRVGNPFDYEEALTSLSLDNVDDGFKSAAVNLDNRFVYDPQLAQTLDTTNGDTYDTTLYSNGDGSFALYLDAGRSGSYLALPERTATVEGEETEFSAAVFVDGVPTRFEGFAQALTPIERNQALSFLQTIPLDYFGAAGSSLGIINTRSVGQPYLLRYVYNDAEQAFVDLSSFGTAGVDVAALDLENADLFSIPGLATATIYDADDSVGTFIPTQLRLVKNAQLDAYVDLFSANIGNPGVISGERIANEVLQSMGINGARVYTDHPEQEVFAPQNYIYNENVGAFINPTSADVDAEALASADVAELEAAEGVTVYYYDEASKRYIPRGYVYNDSIGAFIEIASIEAGSPLEGVDLAEINLDGSSLIDEVTAVPLSVGFSDLIYYDTLIFPDSDPSKTYVMGTATRAEALNPGYKVDVGLRNFTQLWEDRSLLEPLIQVFLWTVAFAFFSVLTTFVMGLFMAIMLNDARLPGKKIIRSLLIVPYAIPGVIGILVWRGMLNENLGIITRTIFDVFGLQIQWFSDASWARVGIILVNLWLGYPYMMLICSGALQAIPSEVYEAAAVDGARPWQRFWNITLPLLLITVGPLLIASFTYNFNNYLMIEALTQGNPPIPGTSTPAGQTDILISYTYNLAFGAGRGADYGYASAITIVIFALVATITLFQYRFTKQWEEVGENV